MFIYFHIILSVIMGLYIISKLKSRKKIYFFLFYLLTLWDYLLYYIQRPHLKIYRRNKL
jgi:hypothetical protein